MNVKYTAMRIILDNIKQLKLRSIFTKLLIVYVILVSIFIAVLQSDIAKQSIKKNEIRDNSKQISAISTLMDNYFRHLKESFYFICSDPQIRTVFTLDRKNKEYSWILWKAAYAVSEQQNDHPEIKKLIVYSSYLDRAFYMKETAGLDAILNNVERKEEWKQSNLQKKYDFKVISYPDVSLSVMTPNDPNTYRLAVLYTLGNKNEYCDFIMAYISLDLLNEYKKALSLLSQQEIIISDSHMRVLSGTDTHVINYTILEQEDLQSMGKVTEDRYNPYMINSAEYYISSKKSAMMDLNYSLIIKKEYVDKIVTKTAWLLILEVVFVCSFILGVVFYVIYLRYRPIMEVMSFCKDIEENNDILPVKFRMLKNRIEEILHENHVLKDYTKESEMLLKEAFFIKLLNNSLTIKEYEKYSKEYLHYDTDVISGVFLFELGELQSTSELSHKLDECCRNNQLLWDIVIENNEKSLLLIVGCRSEIEYNKIFEWIARIAGTGENLMVGAGMPVKQLHEIKLSFEQANAALRNRKIQDETNIFLYSEESTDQKTYYIPVDFQLRMSGYVLGGDEKQVKDYLGQVFEKNRDISWELFVQLSSELSHILKRIVESSGDDIGNVGIDFTLNEDSHSVAIAIKQQVLQMYSLACCYFAETNKDNELKDLIVNYIDNNYTTDIYLEKIAEKFGITANYISKLLKKHMGINYTDYINGLRMKRAKELLETTDMLVKDIGVEVGYQTKTPFLRMFKKFEGISPAEYRVMILKKNL